jgi:hypothetical protein
MEQKGNKKIVNARTINKKRCIVGLIMCSIVIVLTIISLTINIINYYGDATPESGIGTLRMYTTLSNIVATLAAAVCIPFQIEGLLKNKYRLPGWIVQVMYVGATAISFTLVVTVSVISIRAGFVETMLVKSNLYMHTLTPIFTLLLFTLAIADTHIKFRYSFMAIVPTFIYALLYAICVFGTHVWRDHYYLGEFMPWPVAFILFIAVSFGLSQLLRILHNLTNKVVTRNIERYYKESLDYDFPRITDAIAKLAKVEAKFYKDGDDLYFPVDIIKLLSERYSASILPLDIQYDIYLENYLKAIQQNKKK